MTDEAELTSDVAPSAGSGSVEVIGTAHVSADSVEEVERAIEERRPDVVAVELDESRYRQMKGETADDLEAKDLLSGNTIYQFLAYWMLSYVQARLGDRFDIEPGADMKAGIETAERIGAGVALVDRDIQTTIQRFWARMTLVEKLRMAWSLVLAMVGIGGGDEEEFDMSELTDADVVTAMMEEFRRFSPGGAEALIDERDAFIAHRLVALRERGFDVIAVVGAGHRAGIESYLADPPTLPPMESLVGTESGRRFSLFKVLGYLLTVGFLVFFVLLAMAGVGNDVLLRVFVAWFLFNGIFAGGLAKLGGASWPAALVGGAVAWLTSLNPLLAPGWFAGYVELRREPVNVSDIGTLNEILADEESPLGDVISRMLAVPLFRLIAVVALTNIGSLIASVLFPLVVLPMLGGPFSSVTDVTAAMESGIRNSIDLILGVL